jgi:hypothetical protein
MDKAHVIGWLNRYVAAWKSYGPQEIGDLFSKDAIYFPDPFSRPLVGREAIVESWIADPDATGSYDGIYEPEMIEENRAVATGRTLYYKEDGSTLDSEWSNIFLLTFDEEMRCSEYREWYYEKPKPDEQD